MQNRRVLGASWGREASDISFIQLKRVSGVHIFYQRGALRVDRQTILTEQTPRRIEAAHGATRRSWKAVVLCRFQSERDAGRRVGRSRSEVRESRAREDSRTPGRCRAHHGLSCNSALMIVSHACTELRWRETDNDGGAAEPLHPVPGMSCQGSGYAEINPRTAVFRRSRFPDSSPFADTTASSLSNRRIGIDPNSPPDEESAGISPSASSSALGSPHESPFT